MKQIKSFILFVLIINNLVKAENNVDDDSIEFNEEQFSKFIGKLGYLTEIFENMDILTEPCDDFYQYACGDFNEWNPIEPGKLGHGIIYIMSDNINEDLHKVLNYNISINSTKVLQHNDHVVLKAKMFYYSCLNANIFTFNKSEVYANLIELLGGMPVLKSNWTSDNFDLTKTIATLRLFGAVAFIDEYTSDKYIYVKKTIDFGLLPINLNDLNKISSKMYNVNKKLMKYLMEIYGAEENEAIDAVDEILDFGKKFLNKIQHVRPSKPKYKKISYLVRHYPQIDWIQYFSILFGKPVDHNLKVIISDFNYFENFLGLFANEDIKIVANYLMLKLLFELHDELKSAQYPKIFCLKQSQKWLEPVPNLMYIESDYYDDSPEDKVTAIVDEIRNVFKETIDTADWLDESTKVAAIQKLIAMKMLVGSKDISIDLDTLNEFYKNLVIVTGNYHQNNVNVRQFKTISKHNSLGEHSSMTTKVDIEVNAQYRVTSNMLDLPAGILQQPMFHPDMPAAYNFASIGGNIIGHEIVHGFDSIGRHFDSKGRESNWWSPKSNEKFERRAQCFIDQYDNYVIEGLNIHVNGTNTLAENIADNGGLRLGFYAYKKWLEKNKEDDTISLPFFQYTNLKLYFLAFAHASCSEFKRRGLLRIAEDVHAADKYRVNGPVSNFDEFSKAFNCSVGSPMNPIRKCVMW